MNNNVEKHSKQKWNDARYKMAVQILVLSALVVRLVQRVSASACRTVIMRASVRAVWTG